MLKMPVAMARQTSIFKSLAIINSNSKLIYQNRISHVNFVTSNIRFKSDSTLIDIPEKPKKPLSAYLKFVTEVRPTVAKQNPSLKSQEIIKIVSKQWHELTPAAKTKYEDAAKQDKEEYDREILKYNAKLTPEQETLLRQMKNEKREDKQKRKMKKELKATGKPKKPLTSFGLFVREHMIAGESLSDLLLDLKNKWSQMSEVEKEKYQILYRRNKEIYDKELSEWEEKMIKEDKPHLVRVKTLKKQRLSLDEKMNLAKPQ